MSENTNDELVTFDRADILVLIGHLTNALISTNSAVAALDSSLPHLTGSYLKKSGEQIDQILEMFRTKLSDEVIER